MITSCMFLVDKYVLQSNKAEIEHTLVLLAVFTKKYQPWFIKTNSRQAVKKEEPIKE